MLSEELRCSFLLKNYKQCKNKCNNNSTNSTNSTNLTNLNNQFNNNIYCTRHYNKLILEFNLKNSLNNLNLNDDKLFNINKITEIIKNIKNLESYTNLEYINSGTYVDVYKISINNTIYALKYQDLTNNKNMLYYEYLLLSKHFTDNKNIIQINQKSYYYKSKIYALLLTEYINTSFDQYIINNDLYNNIDLVKNIGIQLINVIKYIHEHKYLYIDLKPDNIMFTNNILKLIDFNLCIKYIDSYSKYYPNDKLKTRQGNDIYSSRNINSGFRGVRIDDIESILYIMADLLNIDEFISIKQSKQIKVIIDKKKYLLNQKYKYNFINKFINELNKYISNDNINNKLQNKIVYYDNFIKCLE